MSLENNLKRIADALERIADNTSNAPAAGSNVNAAPDAAAGAQVPEAPAAPAAEQAAPPAPTPAAPAAPATPQPPADEPAAPEAPAAPAPNTSMTMEELNAALVEEFKRLGGNRAPIDKVLNEQFQTQSVRNLKPSQYQGLLDAVRAIPGA